MSEPRDPKTYAVIGAAMEVHRELGPGFLEPVYQEAFEYELKRVGIPYQREAELSIRYKDLTLAHTYRADFICFNSVLVEIKAVVTLGHVEEAQIIHYLKICGLPIGLLINFRSESLDFRRFVFSDLTRAPASAKVTSRDAKSPV